MPGLMRAAAIRLPGETWNFSAQLCAASLARSIRYLVSEAKELDVRNAFPLHTQLAASGRLRQVEAINVCEEL